MIGESGVQMIQAANHWDGREGQTPRYIILHGTAGFTHAQDVAAYFADPSTQASAHYVIGTDGSIIQCVDENDAAWSNGPISGPAGTSGDGIHHDTWWDSGINPNLLTIAIEHVKPHTDNSDELTDAQKQASFRLIKSICHRWNIPMRYADAQGGITGHYSMDPVNRSRCPGPYPWNALKPQLQGEDMLQITDPFAAAFFQDQGGKGWYCPKTGKYIGGAIQTFYCQIQGAVRLPLTNEMHDVPGIVYQIFECGLIVFDPDHKLDAPLGFGRCYVVKYSDSLVQRYLVQPIKDQLTQALAQNAQLLQQIQQLQHQPLQPTGPTLNDIENAATSIKASIGALQTALTDLGVK